MLKRYWVWCSKSSALESSPDFDDHVLPSAPPSLYPVALQSESLAMLRDSVGNTGIMMGDEIQSVCAIV